MKPRFLIVNAMLVVVAGAYWWLGVFSALPALQWTEALFLGSLALYGLLGLGAAMLGRWDTVSHFANSAPKWGLALTGFGLIIAFANIGSIDDPKALIQAAVFAIMPNIVGILVLAWLNEVAWWSGGERV